jgi:hypothetical protein
MRLVYRKQNGKWNGERGSILAISAVSMVAVVLAVGLSVDIGHFYTVAAELQSAADAAALAGASALNSGPSGITLAVDRAVNSMNKFEFNKTSVTINRADVLFAVNLATFDSGGGMSEATASDPLNAPNIRFVQVTIPPKAVDVYFAMSVLGNTVDIAKRAVAGQSVGLNYFCNIAPLSVVQDDSVQNPVPLNVAPGCPNQTEYTPGCTYTVRLQSGNHVTPGNYLILDLPIDVGCGGACEVRRLLARGSQECYSQEDTFDTKTGVNAGPVAQGLNTRFDVYQGGNLTPALHPPDKNVMGRDPTQFISYANYTSGNPAYFQAPPDNPQYAVGDRRVLIIPIINLSEFGNGNTTDLEVAAFGAFFITKLVDDQNGDIRLEYIGQRAVFGDGGYDPTIAPGQNPSLTVPVLYR